MKKQKIKPKYKNFEEFIQIFEKPSFLEEIQTEDNKYYILPDKVQEIKENISRSTFSSGLFLGEKKKGNFTPSLALIELLAKETQKKNKVPKIVIDKKTEWLFICGRDVFKKSISEEDKYTKNGYVFLQNQKDENLGIGLVQGNMILNILDKGDFLRREK